MCMLVLDLMTGQTYATRTLDRHKNVVVCHNPATERLQETL